MPFYVYLMLFRLNNFTLECVFEHLRYKLAK